MVTVHSVKKIINETVTNTRIVILFNLLVVYVTGLCWSLRYLNNNSRDSDGWNDDDDDMVMITMILITMAVVIHIIGISDDDDYKIHVAIKQNYTAN